MIFMRLSKHEVKQLILAYIIHAYSVYSKYLAFFFSNSFASYNLPLIKLVIDYSNGGQKYGVSFIIEMDYLSTVENMKEV